MTTKCILFDADGVIINSEMFSIQYGKKFGIDSEKLQAFFEKEFSQCLVGKTDLKKVVEPRLSKWNWKGNTDEFLQFWFQAEHYIDEGMVQIIKKLKEKGIKCYLATNQEKYRTEYMRNKMGFGELFDHVYSSCELGYKKPEQGFYTAILNDIKKQHNIQANEIMFFDDSQKNVEEASKLDIEAYFYTDLEKFISIINPIIGK